MSRRGWIVIIVILAVVAAALVAVLLVTSGGAGVTVPDVTGMTQDEATAALQGAGLRAGGVEQVTDGTPAGTVVGQDPAGGASADEDSAVALTVSTGPGTVEVPNVMGMDVAAAQQALTEAGLASETEEEYDLRAPAGQVMGQLPAPGEEAEPGSSVGLLVSKGVPSETAVPKVTGLSEQQATRTLEQAGLKAVPVEAFSDKVAEGIVASQDPAAGEVVAPLSEVLIEVSLGKGETGVTVPDLVGMTKAAATGALEDLGLTAKIAQAYSPKVKKDLVMGQEPAAGTEVEPDSDVGLLVSLGPAPSPTPSPSPSKTSTPKPTPTPTPTKTATPKPTATPSPSPTVWPPEIEPPEEPGVDWVKVPDLKGLTLQEAEAELDKLGLAWHTIEQPNEEYAKGLVTDQLPEAGRRVPETYKVFLLVSTGPAAEVNPLPAEE